MLFNKLAYYYSIGFSFFLISIISAQDQRLADSLLMIYKADSIYGLDKLKLLDGLSFNEINNFNQKLKYAEELIKLAKDIRRNDYLYHGYCRKGDAKQFMGEIDGAIDAYFESAEIAKKAKLISAEGSSYSAIGDIYAISGNHSNAMKYYQRAIYKLQITDDTISLATTILNAGDALLTNKSYDSALIYFKESGELYNQADYSIGKAYNLGNTGMVYAYTGKNDIAEKNINEAIKILEESEDYYPISVYLMAMSDIYLEKAQHQTALDYAHRSLSLAEQYQLKEQISEANLKLSQLYEIMGDMAISYKHYKDHVAYRDSLINLKKVQQIADMRTEYEVSQKQIEVDLSKAEVDLLETQKRNQLIILGFTGLLLMGALWFYRAISKEKKKSENLLLNILPEDTAKELKTNGKVKAKQYDSVTVLFTDFKGFTSYSEKLSPEALVETVDHYFSKFDTIIGKYGLEKIKTIGDAYMGVGGLHGDTENHAEKMVKAAFEIAAFVEETKKNIDSNGLSFDIRIGINTGPVVAGVVGTKKFAYDIWGDTVNVASRMESMSEAGKINISENTYNHIKNQWSCEYRGEIAVKNRGKMKMYFVNA